MDQRFSNPMLEVLSLFLRPVVRFCVKRSIGVRELLETLKIVFIDVAADEITRSGKRANVSKISAITGIHRKDVVRIFREGSIEESQAQLTARVVTQWRKDRRFLSASGKPRVLEYRGDNNEFAKLVEAVSTDVRSGAVLFDLERVGAIERTASGLKLKVKAYMPKGDPIAGMKLLATDTEDLMEAVQANIFTAEEELPNYHGNFAYDNIPAEDVPKIRKWLFKQCAALHKKVSKFVSQYDLDLRPRAGKDPKKDGGKRVSVLIATRT